ncbi:MAG: hypothetical protein SGJ20_16825 [Planctomycetota bacterium]|nr:hypothetical protein [Planctomycetota bacterium]
MADTRTVHTEDVVAVGSRVSWGAILAGSVMALAIQAVLALLGGAIGLSLSDDISAGTFGTSASIWIVASLIVSLMVGGYITSQCTVGENHGEAVVHGIIMWGITLALMVWMTATGVKAGFNSVMTVATIGNETMEASGQGWKTLALRAGVSEADIQAIQNRATAAPAGDTTAATGTPDNATVPVATDEVKDKAMKASWITLFTVMLSMAAAAIGAYLGAGTRLKLVGVAGRGPVAVRA